MLEYSSTLTVVALVPEEELVELARPRSMLATAEPFLEFSGWILISLDLQLVEIIYIARIMLEKNPGKFPAEV